jgi:peroxiredoxin
MKYFLILLALLSYIPNSFSNPYQTMEGELQEQSDQSKDRIPDSVKKIMTTQLKDLESSGILNEGAKLGDQIPNGSLLNTKGKKVKIKDQLGENKTIIVFYRGGWCPYCNIQLRHLQKRLPEIKARGGELIAVSPQIPDESLSTRQKNELEFTVLSDPKNKWAKKLGIVFELEGDLKELYQKFGIDLKKNQNSNKWELPLAATYIVDRDGKITYLFKDVDYKKRANIDTLIENL